MKLVNVFLITCITLNLSSIVFGADDLKCVLPSPDGGGPEPSPPSVKGKIVCVEPGIIQVETEPARAKQKELRHVRIRVNDQTKIFTFFGGYVAQNELAVRQQAHIWYVGCSAEKAGNPPLAAVIQIDAKR